MPRRRSDSRSALAKALALLVPAALLAGAFGSQYLGGLLPVRDVLVAALRPYRGARLRRCSPCVAGGRTAACWSGSPRWRSRRAARSASIMPASSSAFFQGFTQCTATATGGIGRRSAEGDHGRADGPLRRGPMVVARNFDGGMECDPFARFRVGDPMAEPQDAAARAERPPGAPAIRAPDVAVDAARRPGRRIWRDPHLCRPARRARRPPPACRPDRRHGRAGAGASRGISTSCSPRAASARPCSSRSGRSPATRWARPPR